jgi:hypothetical protein
MQRQRRRKRKMQRGAKTVVCRKSAAGCDPCEGGGSPRNDKFAFEEGGVVE